MGLDASFPSKVRAIPSHRVILGDCLEALRAMESGSVDAVITDPPYSSGGLFRGDRMADTDTKYTQSGSAQGRRPNFSGDNRDQRSWAFWCVLWMSECRRVVKPGGYLLAFTDWRQLPTTTDVIQASGWLWRGLVAWDKGDGSRAPHRGYFRHQCEYIPWGTNGPMAKSEDCSFGHLSGCMKFPTRQADKFHQTGKPTDLMRRLVQVAPPGGTVLDPFAGSGTTGVACKIEGRNFVGCELSPEYHAIAERRILEAKGAA